MKFIRIPYSPDQWNAQVDSQIYGLGYGIQPGEMDYVKEEMAKRGYLDPKAWSHDMDEDSSEHVLTIKELPLGALKATLWNKKTDHPKVWEDYDSSCGGDTDNGRFYITSGKKQIELFPGDIIYDMADGTFTVQRST